MTVEIRTFAESDRRELLEVFERAGEGTPGSRLWGHAASEAAVYLTPYMDFVADSLFVAVVDGAITGYLTGCPDAASLPREAERIASALRTHHVMRRPSAIPFFVRSLWDVSWSRLRGRATAGDFDDPRWPAHLHINVVPEARGTGIAPSLMGRWLDELREVGAPGCHLQTLVENTRAVRFFERMEFRAYGIAPLVPGLRHHGRPMHQQTMVWNP